jgi:hypothetical protein
MMRLGLFSFSAFGLLAPARVRLKAQGGAPERTSAGADGSCKVTMDEVHALVAKLE